MPHEQQLCVRVEAVVDAWLALLRAVQGVWTGRQLALTRTLLPYPDQQIEYPGSVLPGASLDGRQPDGSRPFLFGEGWCARVTHGKHWSLDDQAFATAMQQAVADPKTKTVLCKALTEYFGAHGVQVIIGE